MFNLEVLLAIDVGDQYGIFAHMNAPKLLRNRYPNKDEDVNVAMIIDYKNVVTIALSSCSLLQLGS